MILRILVRLAKTLLLALGIIIVATLGVLYGPGLGKQRTALAEIAFGHLLDRKVEIAGDVLVSPGPETRIALSEVTISNTDDAAGAGTTQIDQTIFAFPLMPALRGRFNPREVSISGMNFDLSSDRRRADTRASARVAMHFITWLIDKERTPKLTLSEIVVVRRNDPNGWDDVIVLKTVTADLRENGRDAVALKAAGTVNKAAFEVTAGFAELDDDTARDASRTFDVKARVPGADATLKGRVDPDAETIDAQLEVVSKSLAQLLEVVHLKPEDDGSGRLTTRLNGRVEALAADDIKLDVALGSGETTTIEGAIADVLQARGLDLTLTVDLARKANDGVAISSALDIDLRSVKGKVVGALDSLEIRDLLLSTNIASAELGQIGPISVARIVRDKEGRLGLFGLRLLEGDPEKPVFDLTGDIRDAIGISGISFKGSFDINLVALLTGDDRPGMRLAGKLLVSDASGGLEVDELDAKTTGDAFTLALAKHDAAAALRIDFATQDIDMIAKVLGRPPSGGGAASFKVKLQIVDDVSLTGESTVGESAIAVSLHAGIKAGQPMLRGDLNASVLRLSDIGRAAALGEMFSRKPQTLAFEETFTDGFDAELDLKAQRLAGHDEGAGVLHAHLSYKQRQAVVAPLKLALFDGTVDARLTVDNSQESPAFALTGTTDRVDVAALLDQFEAEPLLSGKLHARFELDAQADTAKAIAAQLSGSLEVALTEGVLGTRLIDLAGQDLISWLFSGGANGVARLTCAVSGVAFEQGIGTFRSLTLATENVQLTGRGSLNLGTETLDIGFQPHPLHEHLVNVVTPFKVEGPLSSPEVTEITAGDIAGRAALETVTLPLRPLDLLIGRLGREQHTMNPHPCGDVPEPRSSE